MGDSLADRMFAAQTSNEPDAVGVDTPMAADFTSGLEDRLTEALRQLAQQQEQALAASRDYDLHDIY